MLLLGALLISFSFDVGNSCSLSLSNCCKGTHTRILTMQSNDWAHEVAIFDLNCKRNQFWSILKGADFSSAKISFTCKISKVLLSGEGNETNKKICKKALYDKASNSNFNKLLFLVFVFLIFFYYYALYVLHFFILLLFLLSFIWQCTYVCKCYRSAAASVVNCQTWLFHKVLNTHTHALAEPLRDWA